MRLNQSIRVKTAQVLAIAKSQKKLGVSQAMLARRHRGVQADRAGGGQKHQNLNPQQEQELVNYIEDLPKRGLPPTREMVRNFGSSVARRECSKRWVSLFLERNQCRLISKWTSGMDRQRHYADSYYKYKLYFNLLYSKIDEYTIKS